MYNFILQIILMLSLGAMVYLFARAVPRVSDEIEETSRIGKKIDKLIGALPLEKIDAHFGLFIEKVLRKARLFILRLDNILGRYLHRVRSFNRINQKNGENKSTLFDLNNNGKEKTAESEEKTSS